MSNCDSHEALRKALQGCDVDPVILIAYRTRFANSSVQMLKDMSNSALDAYQARQKNVVITSTSFEGGSSSGQVEGDPKNLVYIFETLIAEKLGKIGVGESQVLEAQSRIMDFSRRRLGT